MSLRYRLFLWVSGLFVVVAVCSFFLENYVSRRELAKAQKSVREKILAMSENRRLDIQKFLAGAIAENEVRIDALLNNISSFSPMALRFGPTSANERNGTWGDASDLLLEYKWIDFLQNTNQGKTTAAIIPQQTGMDPSYRIDIDEDLCWVYVGDLSAHSDPYFAVKVPYTLIAHPTPTGTDEILEQIHGVVPEVFLLFDLKELADPAKTWNQPLFQETENHGFSPIQVKWTEGYELDIAPFVKAFQRGRDQILAKKLQPPALSAGEIKAKINEAASLQDGLLSPIPTETLMSTVASEEVMKERLEDVALRYTQFNVIWVLLAMFDSGIFGSDLFTFPAPIAATVFSTSSQMGIGFDTNKVLFQTTMFDDCAYYKNNAPKDNRSNLGTSLAIIPSPRSSHVFLGNTAEFIVKSLEGERTGFLTLGIDADSILQKLVLAIHQAAVLVHDGRPLSVYGDNGEKIETSKSLSLPFKQMLQEKAGIVPWNEENYFYVHIQPFPKVDLHFFLLNPEAKEFALLRDLETGSQQVVSSILLNIHIAGLVALFVAILLVHNISRKITRPIVQLAKATGDVAEGRLDQINLALPPLKHNDEIALLCHSFEEMVKGLKEKEKVKGVLNKVVSREIAQEILKGSVHLGGEEKKVTVLFADIRDFTKMTQRMQPQEVIELLNVCMTKISFAIDKNNGVIDKYVGDEAMALFGAPISRGDDAVSAIRSAVEIVEIIQKWNQERAGRSQPSIDLGIGIHTGRMLAGNMGAENRLNYTVIGSNVNLAARLCSAAKRMEILITKDTLEEPFVKDRFIYEQMPPITFKGFDEPVDVYRVQGMKK